MRVPKVHTGVRRGVGVHLLRKLLPEKSHVRPIAQLPTDFSPCAFSRKNRTKTPPAYDMGGGMQCLFFPSDPLLSRRRARTRIPTHTHTFPSVPPANTDDPPPCRKCAREREGEMRDVFSCG